MKRTHLTAQQRQECLAYAAKNGAKSAARRFNISTASIYTWQKKGLPSQRPNDAGPRLITGTEVELREQLRELQAENRVLMKMLKAAL